MILKHDNDNISVEVDPFDNIGNLVDVETNCNLFKIIEDLSSSSDNKYKVYPDWELKLYSKKISTHF